MYKAHFEKWAIRKNLNRKIARERIAQRVAVLVSGDASRSEGREANPADAEKLKRYLRRLPPQQYQRMQELTTLKALEAIKSRGQSVADLQRHGVPGRPLLPLARAPDMSYRSESCMRILRNYINGSFEQQLWDMSDCPCWREEDHDPLKMSSGWSGLVQSASVILRDGYTDYAFGILNFCFDQCQYILRSEDPWMSPFVFRAAFDIARTHPELYRSLVRYLTQLSSIIHGRHHPFFLLMEELRRMDIGEIIELDTHLIEAYVGLMRTAVRHEGLAEEVENLLVRKVMCSWGWPKMEDPEAAVADLVGRLEREPDRWFHVDPDLHHFEYMSPEDWAVVFRSSGQVFPAVRWIVRSSTHVDVARVGMLEALIYCEVALQRNDSIETRVPAGYDALMNQLRDSVEEMQTKYPGKEILDLESFAISRRTTAP